VNVGTVCTLYLVYDTVQCVCLSDYHVTEMTTSVSVTSTAKQTTASKDVSGMLSLHTRLQQEAEKIRKWKIQTEIELSQKVPIVQYFNYMLVCDYRY